MSKTSNRFQERIKEYLDEYASKDGKFAEKYANPKKSIEECCDFIAGQVQKLGVQGMDDDEVYGLALHYYQEDDIGKVDKVNYSVVVNEKVELTEEEIAEAKKDAIERITREEMDRIKAKEREAQEKARKKAEEAKKKDEQSGQMSLFGDLFGQ